MDGWKGKEPHYALYLSFAAVLMAFLVVLAPGVSDIAVLLGAFSFVVAAVCVGITLRIGKGLPPAVAGLLLSAVALALVAVFHFTPVDDSLRAFLLSGPEPDDVQIAAAPPEPPGEGASPAPPAPPAAEPEGAPAAIAPEASEGAPAAIAPEASDQPEGTDAWDQPDAPTESPQAAPADADDGLVWSDGAPSPDAFGEAPQTEASTTTTQDYDPGLRPTPTPQQRDPGLAGDVNALIRQAATLEDDKLWESVRALRAQAADSSATQDAAAAHERLDQLIVQRVAVRTSPLYARALERYQAEDLEAAERICNELIALAGSEEIPGLHNPDQAAPLPVTQARLLLNRIDQYRRMRDNPEERFRVRGIVKARGDTLANVEDRLTGERSRVRQGDRIEAFRVERVDESSGTVQLSQGSRNYTLSND